MEKTYHGACVCGQITFEVDLDLSKGSHRCNCSFCRKTRAWTALTTPDRFRLTSGTPAGYMTRPDAPGTYCFCGTCGVRTHSHGHMEELGGDYVTVQVGVLDATPEELLETPVKWLDGLHDNWFEAPKETRYL